MGRACKHCVHFEMSHSGTGKQACSKMGGACPCPGFEPKEEAPHAS